MTNREIYCGLHSKLDICFNDIVGLCGLYKK